MAEHSAKYDTVKRHYDNGLWNEIMVRNAVGRWITEEEAEEILSGKGGVKSEPVQDLGQEGNHLHSGRRGE